MKTRIMTDDWSHIGMLTSTAKQKCTGGGEKKKFLQKAVASDIAGYLL